MLYTTGAFAQSDFNVFSSIIQLTIQIIQIFLKCRKIIWVFKRKQSRLLAKGIKEETASVKSFKDSNQSWIPSKSNWNFNFPDKGCHYCAILLLCNSYTFKNNDKTFNWKAHFTCYSSNHLYVVICLACGKEYIGE